MTREVAIRKIVAACQANGTSCRMLEKPAGTSCPNLPKDSVCRGGRYAGENYIARL